MIAENLMAEITECGLVLRIDGENCGLEKVGTDSIVPLGLIKRLRRADNRAAIVELCSCRECGRTTTNLEDMRVLATNFSLCDRAYVPPDRRTGAGAAGCPYKDKFAPVEERRPEKPEPPRPEPTTRTKPKKPPRKDQPGFELGDTDVESGEVPRTGSEESA